MNRLSLSDRFVSWLVTGPVGRFVAFVADLGAYWLRWALRRDRDR